MVKPSHDLLDGDWNESTWWSTTNVGEAMPGVLTPLCWGLWGPASEKSVRQAFFDIGVLERRRAGVPASDRARIIGIFHGRVAASVNFLGEMGDRLPGTNGAAVAEQFLGRLPHHFRTESTLRRLPVVAAKMPAAMATIAPRLRRQQRATARWWAQEIAANPTYDLEQARAQWKRAVRWFDRTVCLQALSVFLAVQPAYDQVLRSAARAGKPGLGARLLAGQASHVELAVVEDLWRVSRGELSERDFLAEHGYHGPGEGELSSRVWREDPAPVRALVAQYRAKPDSQRPSLAHRVRIEDRAAAERELLAGMCTPERLRAKAALALGDRFVPLRGVGKVAFLQSIDVARAAARRVGEHLAAQGALGDPDDVFHLDPAELLTVRSEAIRPVIGERKQQRTAHQQVALPKAWRGRPDPNPVSHERLAAGEVLNAIGASPGVVEGRVRVVLDADDADIDDGDILVASTTDPGWASVMFVSGALIVDIGGLLSHAAVVARELGIPCVMGSGNGTEVLRTGDVVRVDGHAGTVELLKPAEEPA